MFPFEKYCEVWSRTAPYKTIACCLVVAYMNLRMCTVQATTSAQSRLLWLRDITCFAYMRLQTMAATDIVAISSEIRFNVLVSVISLAACFECCGTTYFSPSLPMFAFVLDAGNVACLLLWTAERVGRACVFRGTGRGGAERRWAERRWAKRRGLVKCVGDNCPAHRSHRLTVHRYKKSTLHLSSYIVRY